MANEWGQTNPNQQHGQNIRVPPFVCHKLSAPLASETELPVSLASTNDSEKSQRSRCGLTTKLSDRRRKRPVGCNSRGQIT